MQAPMAASARAAGVPETDLRILDFSDVGRSRPPHVPDREPQPAKTRRSGHDAQSKSDDAVDHALHGPGADNRLRVPGAFEYMAAVAGAPLHPDAPLQRRASSRYYDDAPLYLVRHVALRHYSRPHAS